MLRGISGGGGGLNGTNGATMLPTTGAPSNALGNNGDFANDVTNGVMYGPKANGVWPAGNAYKGANGTNGAAWYTSSGAPAAGFANVGDYCIDRASALQTYYNKANATTWNVVGNLKGDPGATPAVSSLTFYQSATGWLSATNNTTDQVLTSLVIPANTMQANSHMEIVSEWSITGTVATKSLKISDSASGLVIQNTSGVFSGSGYYCNYLIVSNRSATNSQFIRSVSTSPFATSGANGVAPILGTLDFTVDRTLNFIANFATAVTETIKLEAYQVRIWTP